MDGMLPDLATFAAFSAAAILLILTPGPDMTLFLTRTLTSGRLAGFASLAGVLGGLIVHTALAALGLSALVLASAEAFLVAKMLGALYLIWLSIGLIRRGSRLDLSAAPVADGNLGQIFGQALLVNVLNPKVALFFLTFLPQFVDAHDPHASAKLAVLGTSYFLLSIPLCSLAILMADRLRHLILTRPGALRVIDLMTAGLFTAFALRLLLAVRPAAA